MSVRPMTMAEGERMRRPGEEGGTAMSGAVGLTFVRAFEPRKPATPRNGEQAIRRHTANDAVPKLHLDGAHLPRPPTGQVPRLDMGRVFPRVVKSVTTSRPTTSSETARRRPFPPRAVSPPSKDSHLLEDGDTLRVMSRTISALATERRHHVREVWDNVVARDEIAVQDMWTSGQEVLAASQMIRGMRKGVKHFGAAADQRQGNRKKGSEQDDLRKGSASARKLLSTPRPGPEGGLMQALYFNEDGIHDESGAQKPGKEQTGSRFSPLKNRSASLVKRAKGLWATGEKHEVEEHEMKMAERTLFLKKKLRQMNRNMSAWLRSGTAVYRDTVTGEPLRASEDASPFLVENRELMKEMEEYHGRSESRFPDYMGYNVETTWQTRPAVRHVQIFRNAVLRERRVDTAMQRRRELEAKAWEDLHNNLCTKGPLARIQARERAERAERDRRAATDWLHFITVRGAAVKFYERMMVGKIMAFRKNRAARKILEFCRHWRDKMHKRTRASKRISKFVKGSAIAVTDINKVRLDLSADKVKKFLRDYAEFKTVVPAIMAYKRKVMVMQRCIRAFLIRQRETSAFNEAAWKVMEIKEIKHMMREKRRALGDELAPKLSRPKLGGGRGDPESLSEDSIPHLLLDIEIVREYLHKHIQKRRARYMEDLSEYHRHVEEYKAQKEQRAMLNSRIAEFMGEDDWTKVEIMTTKLADKKFKFVSRPQRVIFSDKCSEADLRELWQQAVVIHGNATTRNLFEDFGAVVMRKHLATAAAMMSKKNSKSASFILSTGSGDDIMVEDGLGVLFAGVKDGDIKARVQMSKI